MNKIILGLGITGILCFLLTLSIDNINKKKYIDIDKVIKSVVQVNITNYEESKNSPYDHIFDDYLKSKGKKELPPYKILNKALGSGFIIDDKGSIVTNDHVAGKASSINITFSDGTSDTATRIGTDKYKDISLLRLDHPELHKVNPLKFASSDSVKLGDPVIVIGSPLGLSFSVSKGIVSSLNRFKEETGLNPYLQVDATINRGNSGGPLFNNFGEVIGVNDAIVSTTGASVGLGLALKADDVAKTVDLLEKNGQIKHPYLGVMIEDTNSDLNVLLGLDKNQKGIFVNEIIPNSPASGFIKPGDLIVSLNGQSENLNAFTFKFLVSDMDVDQSVNVKLIRNKTLLSFDIKLKENTN